jgi:hypothetical protein
VNPLGRRDAPSDEFPSRGARDRRAQLEHVLFEEVGQELTRILRMANALRTTELSAADVALGLEQISTQLVAAIGHCTTAASYFDQRLQSSLGADPLSRRR